MIVIGFTIGLIVGFLWGAWEMWKQMKDETTMHKHYRIDAKEAMDLIESDEAVKQLKKEMEL